MTLKISDSFSLPLDFSGWTQAILAKKGSGKSYTASVEAEELLDAGQQIVVIDPTGAWWGLRSSSDGKSAGYPIAVLGGEHADVLLESTAGEVIADAIAAEHFSAIIDLSLFRKGESLRFMAAFLETLYRKNRDALHLFIDEADTVAPQKPFGEESRVLGACEDIVRRGRIRGIGCTLITQRPQVLNKNVLSQVDMLTALRMHHPKDIAAIDEWVSVHADPKDAKKMIASLPSLPIGDAWVWAPAQDIFTRARIRSRRTFDSGRTPKPGERTVAPKLLAEVDIKRLGATIAATVERVKQDDPKALRARIAELERQLKASVEIETVTVERVVEVPVLSADDIRRLEAAVERYREEGMQLAEELTTAGQVIRDFEAAIKLAHQLPPKPVTGVHRADEPKHRDRVAAARHFANDGKVAKRVGPYEIRVPGLEPRLVKILGSVAWWNALGIDAPAATGVAFMAGYSPTSSGFEKARGSLRSLGLIDYPSGGTLRLTDEGRKVAPATRLPRDHATLHVAVIGKLEPRHGRLLQPLIDAYPKALAMEQLADAAEYSATSSGFEKARGTLRSLGLAEYPRPGYVRASDLLFPGGA